MQYQIEMSQAKREKLDPSDFVFPEEQKWPIQDLDQAKIALTWSTWPQHKKVAKKVREAVFKKYPELKKWFKKEDEKMESKNGSLGTFGSLGDVRARLESMKSLLGDGNAEVNRVEEAESDSSEVFYGGLGYVEVFLRNKFKKTFDAMKESVDRIEIATKKRGIDDPISEKNHQKIVKLMGEVVEYLKAADDRMRLAEGNLSDIAEALQRLKK